MFGQDFGQLSGRGSWFRVQFILSIPLLFAMNPAVMVSMRQ